MVGDFNTTSADPILQNALKDVEISDAIELAGLDQDNHERIDWILSKGFSIEGGQFIEKGISDHPYYEVHFRVI